MSATVETAKGRQRTLVRNSSMPDKLPKEASHILTLSPVRRDEVPGGVYSIEEKREHGEEVVGSRGGEREKRVQGADLFLGDAKAGGGKKGGD